MRLVVEQSRCIGKLRDMGVKPSRTAGSSFMISGRSSRSAARVGSSMRTKARRAVIELSGLIAGLRPRSSGMRASVNARRIFDWLS
jgi:hypothetical protein